MRLLSITKTTIAVCILAAVGLSCKKILDVVPDDSIGDEDVFVSAQKVEAAMNGVYDAAQSGFYAGGQVRGYPFGAASIQQGDMRGEDMLNQALFYQITYEATYNPTSANQQYLFETLYALINKANLFMEGVEKAVASGIITQAKGNQYLGEARFLRALAHHELLINYARPHADGNGSKQGIIYRIKGVDTPEEVNEAKKETRKTVAENYASLLADLDYAEANLPVVSSDHTGTLVKTYRASRGAAIALKTRVKLHMQDWSGVIAEGNKLAPQSSAPFAAPTSVGPWKLEASPVTPFRQPQADENIFSIRNAATDNPGVNGALARMLLDEGSGGRGLVRVSPIVYNLPEWSCDDRRRTELLIRYPLSASGAPVSSTNFYTAKYTDPRTSTDPAPIIRYAEVLLNMAEAEARLSATVSERAIALLNAVRNRSLINPAQQYNLASFASKNELIRAILAERRIEFLAEGKRWGDIHRLALDPLSAITGIPAKIGTGVATYAMYQCGAGSTAYTTAVAAIPYNDRRFLLPIPLSETQQNPNFAQNPGY